MFDCLTCAKSASDDDGQLLTIGADRNIQLALCKHFWFDEDQYLESTICYPCWHRIEDFDRFYREVRQLHCRPHAQQEDQQLSFVFGTAAAEHVVGQDDAGHASNKDQKVNFASELAEQHDESMEAEDLEDDIDKNENCEISDDCHPSTHQELKKNENPTMFQIPDLLMIKREEQVDIPSELSFHHNDGLDDEKAAPDNDQNDEANGIESRSSNKTSEGKYRQRLQKNVKDAVQEYVAKNLTLTCDTCLKRCSSFGNLQRHSMMEHAKKGIVKCCNLRISDNYRFVDHIRFHLDPGAFTCSLCFKQCGFRGELKKHLRIAHSSDMKKSAGDAGHKEAEPKIADSDKSNNSDDDGDEKDDDIDVRRSDCKSARKLIITPEETAKIQMFVLKNVPLHCAHCSRKFNTFKELLRHSMVIHGKRATVQCCNRNLTSDVRFKDHMLFHVNPDRFVCQVCAKKCPNWEALTRHQQMKHTPDSEKAFPCHICDKKFATKLAVSRHARLHGVQASARSEEDAETDRLIAKQFNLVCETCELRCDTMQALQRHAMAEHGKTAHVICCDRKYSVKWKLLDHYYYHQDPTRFQCKLCFKNWPHWESLRLHMKNKHSMEERKLGKVNDV